MLTKIKKDRVIGIDLPEPGRVVEICWAQPSLCLLARRASNYMEVRAIWDEETSISVEAFWWDACQDRPEFVLQSSDTVGISFAWLILPKGMISWVIWFVQWKLEGKWLPSACVDGGNELQTMLRPASPCMGRHGTTESKGKADRMEVDGRRDHFLWHAKFSQRCACNTCWWNGAQDQCFWRNLEAVLPVVICVLEISTLHSCRMCKSLNLLQPSILAPGHSLLMLCSQVQTRSVKCETLCGSLVQHLLSNLEVGNDVDITTGSASYLSSI